MRSQFFYSLLFCVLTAPLLAAGQSAEQQDSSKNTDSNTNNPRSVTKVPQGVILVKGAWPSASDSVTPLPEDGNVNNNIFNDRYFGMTWTLPQNWFQKYTGPPPSDSGRYVLAQIIPTDAFKGPDRGSILITAEDTFFTPMPADNSLQFVTYMKDNLQTYYEVEHPPAKISLGGRAFTSFAYWAPAAQLHWYILATEIRCHIVEIVLSSRDTKLLDNLMQDLKTMKLPAEDSSVIDGDALPVCIKDYASDENVITRVNPVLTEHRYNAIPVRIIIDKEGKVKHIHFLRAFPDQAKAITDALEQWKFHPYLRNGQPTEVETGILFGYAPHPMITKAPAPAPN